MTDLRSTLSEAAAAERRGCIRRLLVRPLLGQRDDPEVYAAAVRHRQALVQWFAEHTGWQLVVDETGGVVRLHKTPAHRDATRPALGGNDRRPFTARRYTLVCLALAALDERPGQTSLRRLAEAVTAAGRDHPGVEPFDATRYAERRAFVDALRLLAGLGVIAERDGDADRYAASESADALYDIDDRRIAQLISAPSSPSLVGGPADLPIEAYPDSDEGQRLRARHRVMRRLLDDPVVYYDDLDERERDWLTHSLRFVHDVLERDVGLTVERRAEGLLAVDPDREVTDETFPDGNSTVKHAALLLAEQLTARLRTGRASGSFAAVDQHTVEAIVADLVATYGERCGWSTDYRESATGAATLAAEVLRLLARFGLVVPRDGGWLPLPAVARYAAAPPGEPAAPAQPSLLNGVP